MPSTPNKTLETFLNPQLDRDYIIEIEAPEFTCLCPKTGQPDFATLHLEYIPDRLCVELKSLKLYIWSFRNEGHFHEKVTNAILNDLVEATQPRYMRLRAVFKVRGGIYTTVTVEHRKATWTPAPPLPPRDELPRTRQSTFEPERVTAPEPAHVPEPVVAPVPLATAAAVPAVEAVAPPVQTPTERPISKTERFRMLRRDRQAAATAAATAEAIAPTPAPPVAQVPAPAIAPTPAPAAAPAPARDIYIGIDLGTTGCRAVAIDAEYRVLAHAEAPLPAPLRQRTQITQDPNEWWKAVSHCLKRLVGQIDATRVRRLAVAGTSATVLLCDKQGNPVTPGLMYNDRRAEAEAERIAAVADGRTAVHGASSSLAKLLWLQGKKSHGRAVHVLHQADWIGNRLTRDYGHSDYHNALKLGYDPVNMQWSECLQRLEVHDALLPQVHAPGEVRGQINIEMARTLGLPRETEITAGTTDSVAAFLAAGASAPGHGVTALGSTLVLKLLSERPIFSAQHGVYSHRLGNLWLAGGASNSGGAVLLQYFTVDQLRDMASMLDPERPTGLDYYPLPDAGGERFPTNDPKMEPRLEPLPSDSLMFLQGMLEGIAHIEAQGYAVLAKLGAPKLTALWTIGGGSQNQVWTRIRERALGLRIKPARSPHTAFGAALVAAGVIQKTFA